MGSQGQASKVRVFVASAEAGAAAGSRERGGGARYERREAYGFIYFLFVF